MASITKTAPVTKTHSNPAQISAKRAATSTTAANTLSASTIARARVKDVDPSVKPSTAVQTPSRSGTGALCPLVRPSSSSGGGNGKVDNDQSADYQPPIRLAPLGFKVAIFKLREIRKPKSAKVKALPIR